MWEVILGGVIAIAGGFLSSICTSYINKKKQNREKVLEAYEEIAKCIFEIDKAIIDFDTKKGTMTLDLFLLKSELYAPKRIRALVKEYNVIINRIFNREIPIEPVIQKKDELKQILLDNIRKSIDRKNGGQA